MGDVAVHEATGEKERMLFVRLPWEIYRDDRYWVPPVIKEDLAKISPSHPFYSHAEASLFIARRNGRAVGRIAAIIDRHFCEYHSCRTGFFGFFESLPDPETGPVLLETARQWLKERDMEEMAGPMNPSTNDICGVLVDGFDSSPCFMMPYNPAYYPTLLEDYGLRKSMDLLAYVVEGPFPGVRRFETLVERIRRKEPGLTVRPINTKRFDEELGRVKEVYNEAWSKNWGFVPITDGELAYLARGLKPLIVPDLCLFAYLGETLIGFSFTLPDYNIVLKRLNGKVGLLGMLRFLYLSRRIAGVRVMMLGIKHSFQKRGAESLLIYETFRRLLTRGYRTCECSWILEDNVLMRRGIEALGGRKHKMYRIYRMPI
jgi:hypothetical protein